MPNFSGIWTADQQFQALGGSTWPSLPGAPTIGTATATSGTAASVTFTAPSSTGYPAGITGYIVTSSPGGLTGTGASSPISVTGLTTGTAYTFTVRAINATGTGPSSAASNSVTPSLFVEDVFSTFTYTGTSAARDIVNGIDLSGNGGLVWIKCRTVAESNSLFTTTLGANITLLSNATDAKDTVGTDVFQSFNSVGFRVGSHGRTNESPRTYVSWTFRKQPKFFDIVTYTGTGNIDTTVPHNLGVVPGLIIIKNLNSVADWIVRTTAIDGSNDVLVLNKTDAKFDSGITISPTTTTFTTGGGSGDGGSGESYVAYLFASNAGGFGTSGTDNIISCGSWTNDGSGNATINMGFEPQWVMFKRTDGAANWNIIDTMRQFSTDNDYLLYANSSGVELTTFDYGTPEATGFRVAALGAGSSYVYVAIRRPMKVPTVGTTVYNAIARTGTAATASITGVGFPPDTVWGRRKDANYGRNFDRVFGANVSLAPGVTGAKAFPSNSLTAFTMDGFNVGVDGSEHINASGIPYIYWNFKRATSFFDVLTYEGTSSARTQAHNLGVAPELMIFRRTGITDDWWVTFNFGVSNCKYIYFNQTAAQATLTYSSSNQYTAAPSSTGLLFGSDSITNGPYSYFAYLFATCAGVSKVGSYTGTGTTLQIDCGFTGGARFILIKRTDSTGSWYIWDTVRGILSGNDPYLIINNVSGSPTAEVTNTDYIDTYSAGFELSSTAPADLNANGGTYIFLAIA